ncbi:MAG: zinc ribbon domain-containing protein [Acidobacteriaceae bacterium]|nr:zinc ribbon domain-containing protein [Acidobacteriaceae bacterium]
MPIYEYKCEGCGDVFEQIQRFSDEPLKVHEKCGGAVHRLLSAPALQFKGSGWYITDYAKSGGPSNGTKKSEGDSSGESKSTTSSDSTNSSPPSLRVPNPPHLPPKSKAR